MYVYSNLFAYSDLNGTYAQCTSVQYVMYIVHICTQYTCTMYTCTIYNVQCTSVYRLCLHSKYYKHIQQYKFIQ